METINSLGQLLADVSEEVERLAEAYKELDGHIAKEAAYVSRLDRIAGINALNARLVREVDRIRNEEISSEHAFNAGKVFSGMLNFAAGSITSAALKQRDPLSGGFKLFAKEFGKKDCFGTVMMAVKNGDKLEDIETIAISRLAREVRKTELDIMSSIEGKGYSLITPEKLWKHLDQLKEDIEAGKS